MKTKGRFITPAIAARYLLDQQYGALDTERRPAPVKARGVQAAESEGIPKDILPEGPMDPRLAYRIIHDELELNSKLRSTSRPS